MNPFITYIFKAAISLAGFYLVYTVLLRNDTTYARNRLFILLSVPASFLLPLIRIQTETPFGLQLFGKTLSEVIISSDTGRSLSGLFKSILPDDISNVITGIYLAGILLFGIRFFRDILNLGILIKREKNSENNIITIDDINTSGFSALGYIFIKKDLGSGDADEIIKHESSHIRFRHFIDIVFIEIITILQWFNPFIYLFNKSLREIHEFQADDHHLRTGIPVIRYQQLIMNQIFSTRIFSITNSFSNPTLTKKRLIMMTKKRSSILANLKLLLVIPLVAAALVIFSTCSNQVKTENQLPGVNSEKNEAPTEAGVPLPPPPPPPPPPVPGSDNAESQPYEMVDQMPVFRGGDQALLNYIAENTSYPENAKKNGITGRVIVKFAIETDGSIDRVGIVKGIDPELDMEAVRVVSSLPDFETPGLLDGKPVPVWYMVPITFALK